ncbi:MAG: helicase-related protein [bacterium]|nr:helicase-related protein [bacterium]
MADSARHAIRPGAVLEGPQFSEPMRVVTVQPEGDGRFVLGLVGTRTQVFRQVQITAVDLDGLKILSTDFTFQGDGALLRLGLQAYTLGIAYEYDPYFALSISRVDPLPHQLEAVYDVLLRLPRVRFLLADDAGAGKTIMAGLLLKELKLRGLIERTLVVCPANLTFQWQRELRDKFDEKFLVLKGADLRVQYGVNQWLEQPQVITSLDLAKRSDVLPSLRQASWDLVVVDEAHRMSAYAEDKKSLRYRLGELLSETTDHYLLLTATPHKGDPSNFTLFLRLLDADAYADVRSIREAMKRRRAPFYLRRTKEAMVHFPEQGPDGTWEARKIFTKRIPRTVRFAIQGDEEALYRAVTRYVRNQSSRAAAQEADPRARAVGFLMSLYQRRLASSTMALRHSLANRARRFEEGLKRAELLLATAPPDLPDPEELEEMEEAERERLEEILEAFTLAQNPQQVREEIAELRDLADRAQAVIDAGVEAKLSKLRGLLQDEGFFSRADQRLLIFTEFKDTLGYLVDCFRQWGFKVGFIHGGMRPGSRDEPGTRLHTEQQFWEGEIQVLVATEAAGEGINLQVCHIMFNYDIPWNPNRLEQRMGRIHRYGQTKDCLIFNFVASNTVEGRILERLMEKLQEIRNALDDDAVFNVVGEVLPAGQIERVLRDFYAGRLDEADLEDRVLRDVQEDRFRAICQHALEGLATRTLNLAMLVERRARAQERRIVPETVARFVAQAAPHASLTLRPVASLPHTFDPGPTPVALRHHARAQDWHLPSLANRYPRLTTDRETADRHHLEWVTPGHPLFEALRRHSMDAARPALASGACFYSLSHQGPARLDVYRARVVDGLGQVVHERLFAVEVAEDGAAVRDAALLGDLLLAPAPADLPAVASLPESRDVLQQRVLDAFLAEVRTERLDEVDRIATHVEVALTELIQREDEKIGRFAEDRDRGVEGATGLLAATEGRHADLVARRERRRQELARQRALTLQSVDRMTSILILPHPERERPEIRRLQPDPETEQVAMEAAMVFEQQAGRQVLDVHTENLGYDLTSIDPRGGEVRLIEVKGLAGDGGDITLTPNEYRVAQDRRDCYWLYVVTNCRTEAPRLSQVKDPATYAWQSVRRVEHYVLPASRLVEAERQ